MASVQKFPIIGGPLDGQYSNMKDWDQEWISQFNPRYDRKAGRFAAYDAQYTRFNAGDSGSVVSCVWLHQSLLKQAQRLPQ